MPLMFGEVVGELQKLRVGLRIEPIWPIHHGRDSFIWRHLRECE
jgi:hypothetical protein